MSQLCLLFGFFNSGLSPSLSRQWVKKNIFPTLHAFLDDLSVLKTSLNVIQRIVLPSVLIALLLLFEDTFLSPHRFSHVVQMEAGWPYLHVVSLKMGIWLSRRQVSCKPDQKVCYFDRKIRWEDSCVSIWVIDMLIYSQSKSRTHGLLKNFWSILECEKQCGKCHVDAEMLEFPRHLKDL